MNEFNELVITDDTCKFKTQDVQFRSVNRKTQQKHISILYALYFCLIFVILGTVEFDKIVDWCPLLFLVLYFLTFVENFMAPMYKSFVCKSVECTILIKDDKLIMKHLNAFGRLIVHIYDTKDIDELSYMPVPARIMFSGTQTYEIHLTENDYEIGTKPVKSVKIKDKSYVRVSNEDLKEVIKFIEQKLNKQFKEI